MWLPGGTRREKETSQVKANPMAARHLGEGGTDQASHRERRGDRAGQRSGRRCRCDGYTSLGQRLAAVLQGLFRPSHPPRNPPSRLHSNAHTKVPTAVLQKRGTPPQRGGHDHSLYVMFVQYP